MCRVTRKHTWEHHISTEQLEQRLGVVSIDTYLHTAGSFAGSDTCGAWTSRSACPTLRGARAPQ